MVKKKKIFKNQVHHFETEELSHVWHMLYALVLCRVQRNSVNHVVLVFLAPRVSWEVEDYTKSELGSGGLHQE